MNPWEPIDGITCPYCRQKGWHGGFDACKAADVARLEKAMARVEADPTWKGVAERLKAWFDRIKAEDAAKREGGEAGK